MVWRDGKQSCFFPREEYVVLILVLRPLVAGLPEKTTADSGTPLLLETIVGAT